MTALFLFLYLSLPAVVLYGCYRFSVLDKIGAVLLCYMLGLLLGNSGLIEESYKPALNLLSELAVALALPLLLFSLDVRSWSSLAGKALLSMVLAMAAVIVVSFLVFLAVNEQHPDVAWQLAGMSIGVYTGGAPNLASIKTALAIDSNTYIQFHTYDTLMALIYLSFVLSIAQRLFNKFLPAFEGPDDGCPEPGSVEHQEELASYRDMARIRVWPKLTLALLLSSACMGVALLIGAFIPADYSAAAVIAIITSLGVSLSFVGPVRRMNYTFNLGMYLVYVFCIVVASMADLSMLANVDWSILGVVLTTTLGAMLVHAVLCKFFKVDTDTFLITSVAAICSPPFVPLVAGALNNPRVLLSGLSAGIIGYAAGNYLGISLAYLFKALF